MADVQPTLTTSQRLSDAARSILASLGALNAANVINVSGNKAEAIAGAAVAVGSIAYPLLQQVLGGLLTRRR